MRPLVNSLEDFGVLTRAIQEQQNMPYAYGIGISFTDSKGQPIAVRWITVNVSSQMGTAAVLMDYLKITESPSISVHQLNGDACLDILYDYFSPFEGDGKLHSNIDALKFGFNNPDYELKVIFYFDKDDITNRPVTSNEDAHFRLALLSRRHFQPNQVNLDGVFGHLPNLIWTSKGVHTLEDWNQKWFLGEEQVLAQDKFPPMFWANPAQSGVRVANADMVRHGAHLAGGTTVMHYGFVNANAGTLGEAMVEGRISYGTTIDDGTDVGAGAGFLGTLSGGNTVKIKTGKGCLIGAMGECGIPLGDRVCIAAGLVFTGNTPVQLITWKVRDGKFETDGNGHPIEVDRKTVKAIELANISNVTFRRNALTGVIEVLPVPNKANLNDLLHKND